MPRMENSEVYSILDSVYASVSEHECNPLAAQDFADLIEEIGDGTYEDTVQEWLRDHGYV